MNQYGDMNTWLGNGFSLAAIIGTLGGFLPPLAAAVALFWYFIQIWESKTVQDWYVRRSTTRKTAKIAYLKAQQKVLAAELAALEVVRQAQAVAVEKVEQAKAQAVVEQANTTAAAEIKKVTDGGK